MKRLSATVAVVFGTGILVAQFSYSADEVGSTEELLQQAESAIAKLADPKDRIDVRTKLALAFHRAGNVAAAASALMKSLTEDLPLVEVEDQKEAFIGSIAVAQAQMGQWDIAFRTMGTIKNNRDNPAWGFLFDLALEAGEMSRAIDIAARIEDAFLRDVSTNMIVAALASQGKLDQALELRNTIKNGDVKAVGLILVCQSLWESQKFDEIDRIEKLIEKPEQRANVLFKTTLAELEAGDRVRADRTRERLKEIAKHLDEELRIRWFALIQAHLGESAKAIEIAETDQIANSRQHLLAEIATVLARNGDGRKAHEVLRSIEKSSVFKHPSELYEVRREAAIALAAAGNMADAAETAESIDNLYIRSQAWRRMADSQAKADRKGAKSSLTKALLVVRQIPLGSDIYVWGLQEVAQTQAETGDVDAARVTFRLALQATLRYEDERRQAQMAYGVARVYAQSLGSIEIREWALMQSSPLVAAYSLIGASEGRLESK